MPRLFVPAVFALVAASLATLPAAHEEPATSPRGASQATQQPPPAQNPPAGQPQQGQQPPVFRGEIDVIRLDVSVLDKDRHPVRGLTADDFTVLEDGKPQRLVAVSEVEAATNDPRLSAWMRHTPSDIATNDLADQMGDGRAFGLIMDDWNIPFDDLNIVMSAREVGRYVIDQLGPSDIAAVIFPQQAGRTQDFTDDRGKLITAIDKFDPPEIRYLEATPQGTSGGGGDMPYRYSSALARTTCLRSQPAVPALETLVLRMASVPNKRKTVVLVSTGLPITFMSSRNDCMNTLTEIMKDVFRTAQRFNINIYTIDPAGYRGYEEYLQTPIRRGGRPAEHVMNMNGAAAVARGRREFLQTVAENTGARAIVNTNEIGAEIDQIFDEAGTYYLVGYQTSNGKPDGKYRKIEVKVKRPGMTVRTRSGFYAAREGSLATAEAKALPATIDLGLSGMMSPAQLPLRATAVPVGRTGKGKETDVAVVLTVRLPPSRTDVTETLNIVRMLYDSEGRAGDPIPDKKELKLPPATSDEMRYDVYQKLTLAPGRYQVRLNATSTALGKSSSVYADIDVPDFTRPAVSATAVLLGTKPGDAPRTDLLAPILPIVPTSARDFSPNEPVVAFLRVFQGGANPLVPITVTTQVLDTTDSKILDTKTTLAAEAFDPAVRSAPFEVALPLSGLAHGPYLLSITATTPTGSTTRRDLVFRVR